MLQDTVYKEMNVMLSNENNTNTDNTNTDLQQLVKSQRTFFSSKATYPLEFRIEQLKKLKHALQSAMPDIVKALYEDLGRCEMEAEFDLAVIKTIDYFIANLPTWLAKKSFPASTMQAPAEVYIEPIPLGACLIISPWNYPIELTIAPLLGAISAGNTAIIKPSEYSPNCSQVLSNIINNTFDSDYLHVVTGDAAVAEQLLTNKFAHIFYTGSTAVGRKVYEAASHHLTPVILELGGKSPCVVDKNIDYKQAAKRILFGKLINSGQTCVAPDYCLVDTEAYDSLVQALQEVLLEFHPQGALKSKDYSKIISLKHLQRLQKLLALQNINDVICGGDVDVDNMRIAPCIINLPNLDDCNNNPVMQEEIFGPILPIICYKNLEDILKVVAHNPQPLALYVFTNDDNFAEQVLDNIQSGGSCINDIMVHLFNDNCGFGGIGTSGLGAYHGELSFKAYSHFRTVAKRKLHSNYPLDVRFPPYHNIIAKLFRKFFM